MVEIVDAFDELFGRCSECVQRERGGRSSLVVTDEDSTRFASGHYGEST